MEIKLIKTIVEGIKMFNHNKIEIDLVTLKKVTPEESDEHIVENLFGNIYKQNVLAFAGINASGKTTTLKIVSTILELFIQNKSFETISNKEVLEHFQDICKITNYFYFDKKIYELVSIVERNINGDFQFTDEHLKIKRATNAITKAKLYDFEQIPSERNRKEIEKLTLGYLKKDTSIFMQVLNEANVLDGHSYVYDMTKYTNKNDFSTAFTLIPAGYIQYLDPDIESIEFINRDNIKNMTQSLVKIKFYNQDVKEITVVDLWKYLSSGTIKGINLLMSIEEVLKVGGYMVIDELENHLNKTVAITMINLFKSEINIMNATLIFSTHYSEILDDIDRSDSVYFCTKEDGKITVTNLSDHISRGDKKKSNLYLSGLLGTAPKYSGYKALKKSLKQEIGNTASISHREEA